MLTRLVLVHALSPLHAGTGQSVGAIDLPIARERPTGIPLVPGSSIKGALRARSADTDLRTAVFGPETTNSSEHAGAVQFSDAHLVALPVRSVAGTFAWTTSPYLLRRFARDAREAGVELPAPPVPAKLEDCIVLATALTLTSGERRRVVLEDLDFAVAVESGETHPLAVIAARVGEALFPSGTPDADSWRTVFRERLCLVHDDVMSHLLETATEVDARIRLSEETKTVAKGALWYEESLPAESLLAGIAAAAPLRPGNGRPERTAAALLDHVASLTTGLVQLGGKANTGRGSCLVRLAGGAR
jgi:CRISPR-associated protein Cmr4